MPRSLAVLILSATILTASACAHHPTTGDDVSPVGSPPVRVEVRNNYALSLEVEASGSGSTQRLGTVNPGTIAQFIIPQSIVGNGAVELQAHPTANNRDMARSGPLILSPGAVVDFVIGTQLFASTATVRP